MSNPDPETKALQDAIFLSKVARARQTPDDAKLLDGPRLFDQVCERMRDGIRHEHPEFSIDEVETELLRQLAVRRRLDERGFYEDAGIIDEQS